MKHIWVKYLRCASGVVNGTRKQYPSLAIDGDSFMVIGHRSRSMTDQWPCKHHHQEQRHIPHNELVEAHDNKKLKTAIKNNTLVVLFLSLVKQWPLNTLFYASTCGERNVRRREECFLSCVQVSSFMQNDWRENSVKGRKKKNGRLQLERVSNSDIFLFLICFHPFVRLSYFMWRFFVGGKGWCFAAAFINTQHWGVDGLCEKVGPTFMELWDPHLVLLHPLIFFFSLIKLSLLVFLFFFIKTKCFRFLKFIVYTSDLPMHYS